MKHFYKNKPVLASIATVAAFLIMLRLVGEITILVLPDEGYARTCLGEGITALFAVGVMALAGRMGALRYHKTGFFASLVPCFYFLISFVVNISKTLVENMGNPTNDALQIVLFCLAMLLIGVTEEVIFRGVIAGAIIEKYGTDRAGVWFSAIISGIIFGSAHLNNVFVNIDISGVLVQTVIAIFIGITYTAVYYRTGNLWVMILIHALNDFTALLASGIFAQGTMTETVSAYSSIMLIAIIPYSALAFLILRNPKMRLILGRQDISSSEKSMTRLCITISALALAVIACIVISVITDLKAL